MDIGASNGIILINRYSIFTNNSLFLNMKKQTLQFLFIVSIVFFYSCKKSSSDPAPAQTPVNYNDYNWLATISSSLDTVKVVNSALHVSVHPINLSGPNTAGSDAFWNKGGLEQDFTLIINYEKASDFVVYLNPLNSSNSGAATIWVGGFYSSIDWDTSYHAIDSTDLFISTSGSITLKRTGASLKVTIVKNSPSGSQTHEEQCSTFSTAAMSFVLTGIGINAVQAGADITSVSITDHNGVTVTDGFDNPALLYTLPQ